VKPSRTYSIAKLGVIVLAVFAALLTVVALRGDAATFPTYAASLADLGIAVAGLAGIGSGSLAARDSATRGATSSASDVVLKLREMEMGRPGTGEPAAPQDPVPVSNS
jgi:hypothetical protein